MAYYVCVCLWMYGYKLCYSFFLLDRWLLLLLSFVDSEFQWDIVNLGNIIKNTSTQHGQNLGYDGNPFLNNTYYEGKNTHTLWLFSAKRSQLYSLGARSFIDWHTRQGGIWKRYAWQTSLNNHNNITNVTERTNDRSAFLAGSISSNPCPRVSPRGIQIHEQQRTEAKTANYYLYRKSRKDTINRQIYEELQYCILRYAFRRQSIEQLCPA